MAIATHRGSAQQPPVAQQQQLRSVLRWRNRVHLHRNRVNAMDCELGSSSTVWPAANDICFSLAITLEGSRRESTSNSRRGFVANVHLCKGTPLCAGAQRPRHAMPRPPQLRSHFRRPAARPATLGFSMVQKKLGDVS